MGIGIAKRCAFVLVAAFVATGPGCAFALDPALEVSQYGHTAWSGSESLAPGVIGSIAQTSDGYLWLGSSSGLLRFDGVRSVAWQPPPGSSLPDERIRALLGTRDGSLWIGTLRGLAILKGGVIVVPDQLKGKTVNALEEAGDGTVWVGGTGKDTAFLCAFRAAGSECHGDDGSLGRVIASLYLDPAGALWVAGTDHVWKWKPQPVVSYALPSSIDSLRTMTGTPDGAIVVAAEGQILKIQDGRVQTLPIGAAPRGLVFTKVLRDHDGALWIGAADFGVLHLHDGRLDVFRMSEGLSGDHVVGLFEDREGNVWVSTSRGLDRFRPVGPAVFSRAQGVSGRVVAVLAARDGAVWASTSAGLYRLERGQVEKVRSSRSAMLFEDHRGRVWMGGLHEIGYMEGGRFVVAHMVPPGHVDGIAGDSKGNIWIAERDVGLIRLRSDGKVEQTPWTNLGQASPVSAMALDPADESLWLGLWSGRVLNVSDGKVRKTLNARDIAAVGRINHMRVDADGTLWIATRLGLSRVRGGHAARLDSGNGLPCDVINWTHFDENSAWLYTGCGLIQFARRDIDAWAQAAERGAPAAVKVRALNYWDGVRLQPSVASVGGGGQVTEVRLFTPKAAQTRDGKIWLASGEGITVVDPARRPFNGIAPPVHVERVVSDGTAQEPRAPLRLPPLPRNLEIEYTGLSFTAPEKVQFRYKLDGHDASWQDAGNRRHAFYTDLPPGPYRFQVVAANNSGVWNEQGDSIEFSIAPAWWQTNVFRVSCALAFALLLYGLHRLRLARLARELHMTLDARVNERLRISRELHDTLLQNFQGVLLKFQAATSLLPAQPAEARRRLEDVMEQAEQAVVEGRDTVRELRASTVTTNDLAEALAELGTQIRADYAGELAPEFRVVVEGETRDLVPLVRDEVHRIAGEAVRNAFHHSQSRGIDVHIQYEGRQFRLVVRDDGMGIAPDALAQGDRAGHFGLRGMEERAQLAGGTLTLAGARGGGTEVTLVIPASRAYPKTRKA
jgi:signal transduction histidine kinase/ligand-binding sensor domain-containing protein